MPEPQEKPRLPAFPTAGDRVLIRAWTHNRPATTATGYARDVAQFLAFTGKALGEVVLADLQAWDDSLAGLLPASRRRKLNAIRSLVRYGREMGALDSDPVKGLRVPKAPEGAVTERILTEEDIRRLVDGEPNARRRALLRLLYLCGLRASEAAAAKRAHAVPRPKGGAELRIVGKGSKLRTVTIPPALWREIEGLHPAGAAAADTPLIPNRDGRPLDRFAVHRAVKRAARRAGLGAVSAHWFRHSHASHALDRGAPVQTVQKGLGHASLATTSRYSHVRPGDSAGDYLTD